MKVTRKQKYGNLKGVPKEAIDGNMMFMLIITKIILIIWVGRMNMNGVLIVLASNIVWPEMVTTSEPLINKKSELDDDFGFDNTKYFDDVYIFNDRTINGQTYTMHLESEQ